MAVTTASFKLRFPEFADADTGVIDGALTSTIARTNGDMSEAEKDELVCLRLADFLARSPFARDLKLMVATEGDTAYSKPLRALTLKVGIQAVTR